MKRIILLCLSLFLLLQFTTWFPSYATSDVQLYKADSKDSSIKLQPRDCYGVQFCATSDFNSVTLDVKSVSRPTVDIAGVKLSLYIWDTSYEQSMAITPVATKEHHGIYGKTAYSLSAETTFSAGEYLFVFESLSGSWQVTSYEDSPANVRFYDDGHETTKSLHLTVNATQKSDFLGTISENVKLGASLNPNPSSWVATDGLGRTLSAYGKIPERREEKYVGVFYWDVSGYQGARTSAKSVQQLLDSVDKDTAEAAKNDYNHNLWKAGSVTWFWDQPLFGYYTTQDDYVVRKHAELLADADVDVVFIDFCHTLPEKHDFMNVFEVFQQARSEGVDAPDIAFVLPLGDAKECANRLRYLYKNLYEEELYKDLWFYYEEKPLIVAYPDGLSRNELDGTIRRFFTYRKGDAWTWRTEKDMTTVANGNFWGWLNTYPQTKYYNDPSMQQVEQMTVGVAQNVNVVEHKSTAMNGENVAGRSYAFGQYSYSYKKDGKTVKVTPNIENSVLYGINFQQQWDYAIEVDPTFIFVTGWNEWAAGRYETFQGVKNAFPDQYNAEYSRDIEPSAGILKDYYYYQLVANIRRFKGVDKAENTVGSQTIDIYGDLSQWNSVESFDHYAGNTRTRNENGYLGYTYKNDTMRNDIIRSKVAYDRSNVYFYVETVTALTAEADPAWMRLFIDTEFSGKSQNWEGFEYVINRINPENGRCTIERSKGTSADGSWLWEEVGNVSYTVSGNVLQIAVPRKMLGFSDGEMAFNFKWSDNMQNQGDIMDFYQNGDVAPGGRFMFRFQTSGYKEETSAFWQNSQFWLIVAVCALMAVAVVLVIVATRMTKKKDTVSEGVTTQ